MEKASRVMYSIANIFNWILAIFAIAGIVLSILGMVNVLPEDIATNYQFGVGTLIWCIFAFLVTFITILMVRRAKAQGSSKAWDVLFIILGVLAGNLFYILGGIFGLVARR